jgi:hypothetical protein
VSVHKWTLVGILRQGRIEITSPTREQMTQNGLLAVLIEEDRFRLAPQMMVVDMPAGGVLHRAGDNVVDTWFPLGATLAAFSLETV